MPNRYICTVLEEMRNCSKTLNFSILNGLIEEAQTLANRMEAGLQDYRDAGYAVETISEKNRERRKLDIEIRELRQQEAELERKVAELKERFKQLKHGNTVFEKKGTIDPKHCSECGENFMHCECVVVPADKGTPTVV